MTTEELKASLFGIANANGYDVDSILKGFTITEDFPKELLITLKEKLSKLKFQKEETINSFCDQVVLQGSPVASNKVGGVTKLEFSWGVYTLYLSHETLDTVSTISDWAGAIAFIAETVGAAIPTIALILGFVALQFLVWKVFDRGNGITLTKPLWNGGPFPWPQ